MQSTVPRFSNLVTFVSTPHTRKTDARLLHFLNIYHMDISLKQQHQEQTGSADKPQSHQENKDTNQTKTASNAKLGGGTVTSQSECFKVGMFCSHGPLDEKQRLLMTMLANYFTETRIREVLLPIISEEIPSPHHPNTSQTSNKKREPQKSKGHRLSLRALDWLVTNYAKKTPIIFKVQKHGVPERVINIYTEYKTWLWKYRRSNFDPFRRRQRLRFKLNGTPYTTTVGQLNFMFWAERYGVLEYARTHLAAIEADHAATTQEHRRISHKQLQEEPGEGRARIKKKRRQLSSPPRKKAFVFSSPVTISFNPGSTHNNRPCKN